jgi:hypothetical protein
MFELKEDCDIVWMGVVLDDGETDSMKGGHREGFYTRGEIVLDRDQHDLRRIGSVFGQFSETDLLSFPTFPALQFKPTTAHNCSSCLFGTRILDANLINSALPLAGYAQLLSSSIYSVPISTQARRGCSIHASARSVCGLRHMHGS